MPLIPKGLELVTLTCLRCGHAWVPRRTMHPLRCAGCRSPYWDREREPSRPPPVARPYVQACNKCGKESPGRDLDLYGYCVACRIDLNAQARREQASKRTRKNVGKELRELE